MPFTADHERSRVSLNIPISAELHKRLKIEAANTGRTLKQTVIEILETNVNGDAR